MRLSGTELMQATGGSWRKGMPESISGVDTDTRKFHEGHAFLALRGPNFDGHRFAGQVASQASALIGDEEGIKLWDNLEMPQLTVEDTLAALGQIANAWRQRLDRTTVIAITGSYGKTTVRSMLAHLFTSLGIRTHATHANLNNLIGVPATLLAIEEDTEVALVECGISEKGEMASLSQIVQPDVAVITGITAAHSEGLGGIEGVAREKGRLAEQLSPEGWCVLGSDVSGKLSGSNVTASRLDMDSDEAGIVRWQLDGVALTLFTTIENASITLPIPAAHWAADMALAATVVTAYFGRQPGRTSPSLADIAETLSAWQPVDGRMQMRRGAKGATIIDDSYNANPVSMQAAIDTLARMGGHKVAILGDMAELKDATAGHRGLLLEGVDTLVLVGKEIQVQKRSHPEATSFVTTDEAVTWARHQAGSFGPGDSVLVKASRSMHLERVADALCGGEGNHAL